MRTCTNREKLAKISGLVGILFGLLTIVQGGRTLFVPEVENVAGNILPFVLKFNFVAGFFYVLAGLLLFKLKPAAKYLSIAIAVCNVFIFFRLNLIAISGEISYEPKTYFAMIARVLVWAIIATISIAVFQRPFKSHSV